MDIEVLIFALMIFFLFGMGMLISIIILVITCFHHRSIAKNIPLLLTLNTNVSIFMFCLMMILLYSSTVCGELHPLSNLKDTWCFVRYHLITFVISHTYYSYCLHALARFFRIVYHKQRFFQRFSFFLLMVFVQYLIALILAIATWLLNFAEYLPLYSVCLIPYGNTGGYAFLFVTAYFIPLGIVLSIYIVIIRYTQRTVHIQTNRNLSNQRDLVVRRRIIIVFLVSLSVGVPTLVFLIKFWITNQMTVNTARVQVLGGSISLSLKTVAFAFVTPQIKEIFQCRPLTAAHPRTRGTPVVQIPVK